MQRIIFFSSNLISISFNIILICITHLKILISQLQFSLMQKSAYPFYTQTSSTINNPRSSASKRFSLTAKRMPYYNPIYRVKSSRGANMQIIPRGSAVNLTFPASISKRILGAARARTLRGSCCCCCCLAKRQDNAATCRREHRTASAVSANGVVLLC